MLKIPKTFIDQLTEDADANVVDAILRLAGSLDLVTVAEGIEHVAQAERVRELGCGLGQGYLFSRPVRAGDVVDLLRARQPARSKAVAAA
jgi:EAL domain-containing protein (putative c-di-GMP-specific phosphodiesterase class I)